MSEDKPKKRQSWTFRMRRRFWLRADLSLGAKGIGAILLSYANAEGLCWPTVPQIAADACVSEDTADRYMKELHRKQVIEWEYWRDEQGRKRRRFNLNPMGVKYPVGHGGKITPLTSTSIKQAERLFVPPSDWDGLGGKKYDGRRTLNGSE